MTTGFATLRQRLSIAAAARRRRRLSCQLTTVDVRDGSLSTVALRGFTECLDSWLIVGEHPNAAGWLQNIQAYPDRVWLRLRDGVAMRVDPEPVAADEHRDVWRRITTEAPEVASRQAQHGHPVPILRLVQAEHP